MTDHTTAERLKAIRERLEKATAGPWWFDYNWLGERGPYAGVEAADYPGHFIVECRKVDAPNELANTAFIAHARQDIPWLLDHLAQREAQIRAAVEQLPLPIHKDSTSYRLGYMQAIDHVLALLTPKEPTR